MRSVVFRFVPVLLVTFFCAELKGESLEAGWTNPPLDARTRCFWWWLNGNVTKEAITRDLEQMKAKGMGGGLIFDADGSNQQGNRGVPAGPLWGSEAWQELFRHAVEEADRLGLELSMAIQSGWNLGGPTITPAEAAKRLVWSKIVVDRPGRAAEKLPMPETRDGYYRDVAVLAVPVKKRGAGSGSPGFRLSASSNQKGFPAGAAVDGDESTYWVSNGFRPGEGPSGKSGKSEESEGKSEWIEAAFESDADVGGLRVLGRPGYGPRRCRLLVAGKDGSWREVGEQLDVADGKTLESRFPPVRGRRFRLDISAAYDSRYPDNPRNVQIAEFTLLDAQGRSVGPKRPIRDLAAKSMVRELGGSAPDCRPLLFDVPPTPGEADVSLADVVDLTDRLRPDGTLDWTVPDGSWTILRFGYTPTSAHVSTASGEWQGAVLDYLDDKVLRSYWKRHVAPMLDRVRPHCGKALKYVETDSWECGGMNWSPGFEKKFGAYSGYDCVPWLPVFAGIIVEDRESSNAFLADFRKALGHYVAEHYRVLDELAAEYDLGTQPESGGPHAGPLDGITNHGRSDLAMSEFWRPSPHRPRPENRFFVKQAASAAHTYGIKLVGAEGFTSIGPHWNDSFWRHLKPSFDHEACDGVNLTFIHTFTCSPKEQGLPGQEYFAGTHFNPNCTWWPMAGAFIDYLNRCQWMLQQGRFVADVAYYYGDHVPNIARRKADDPAGVLPEYDYDVLSEEILLRLDVADGTLTLPSGMKYQILVLPDHRVLSLAALKKVGALIDAGATVVGPKPIRAVSLLGGVEGKDEFDRLADTYWDVDRPRHVIEDASPKRVLQEAGVSADFTFGGGEETNLAWIHRTTDEGELYFVANQSEEPVDVSCSFRVSGRRPEIWNPVDGSRREATAFTQKNGRTVVPLEFGPNGSFFILFGESIPVETQGTTGNNSPRFEGPIEISGPWTVRFDPEWGGPESIVFDDLVDWSRHPDDRVKYYSGIAVYEKRFVLPDELDLSDGRRVFLDFGDVREMADVRLNDHSLGVVWSPPFRVDVTQTLRRGENRLLVRVANQWPNRIIGDLRLPKKERRTRTNIMKYEPNTPLLPSGLLGPANLIRVNSRR